MRFVLKAALKAGIPTGALIAVFFLFHSVGLPDAISALTQLSKDSRTSVVAAPAELPVVSPDRAPVAVKSANKPARALLTTRRRAARARVVRSRPVQRLARAHVPSALPTLPARPVRGRMKGNPVQRPRRRLDPGSVRSGAPSVPRRAGPKPKPVTSPAPPSPSPTPTAPAPQPPAPVIPELPPILPIPGTPELPPLSDPLSDPLPLPQHPEMPSVPSGLSLQPGPSGRP